MKTLVTQEVVWLALEQLKKDNLLENSKDFEIDFNGLNRRQIIKKVGLGSMFALPFVVSIIAPAAANAASTICTPNAPGCVVSGLVPTIQPNAGVCFGPLGVAHCCSCMGGPGVFSIPTMECFRSCT